jgi:hypothetical protein
VSDKAERAALIQSWLTRAKAGEAVEAPPKKRAGRGPAQHGTRSKYAAGCRCPQCREAARVYARERAAKLAGRAPPVPNENGAYPKAKRGRPRATERGARDVGVCTSPTAHPPHMHCICGCPMNRLPGEPRRRYCVSCVELGRAEELPTIDDLAVLSPGASPEIQ